MAEKKPYQRFMDSMVMDYEKWHDGIGYDLNALKEMTHAERQSIAIMLANREQTWREIEALAHLDGEVAERALEDALGDRDADTRLAAADALHRAGKLPDLEDIVAEEIRGLTGIGSTSVRVLMMAEGMNTEPIRQALLQATWNGTDVSTHCAGMLCYFAGIGKVPFDWDIRPFLLKFHPRESWETRRAAFKELCEKIKMQLEPLPDELKDSGPADDWTRHE